MSEVAELLAQSISQHQAYRSALTNSMPAQAIEALQQARDLRQQADAADPEHRDPAWASQERKYPHQPLMAFYGQQVEKYGHG
jgi:hypothetical protein